MLCRTMDHANVETTARVGLSHSRPKLELFFSNANILLMFLAKQDYGDFFQNNDCCFCVYHLVSRILNNGICIDHVYEK